MGTPATWMLTGGGRHRKEINVNVHSFPQRAHDASNRVVALFQAARHPRSPGGVEIVPCEERAIEDAAHDTHALTAATVHSFRVAQAAIDELPESAA